MPNIEKILRNTEEKWLEKLFAACAKQFSTVHLPSHDEFHHLRVWNYAKQLIHLANKQGIVISETDVERLMVCVFFHDQGMSITHSKDHGTISRKICKDYLLQLNIQDIHPWTETLQAIEDHDKKNYGSVSPGREFNLQAYLNIADDLDAFGTIGTYRYLEIYLLRNIPVQSIPDSIFPNLSARFQHFSDTFGNTHPFIKGQHQRYITTHNFFKDLQFQLKQMEYTHDYYFGPIGVVNYIKNEIIAKKIAVKVVCKEVGALDSDFYTHHFFDRLQKETGK